VENIVKERPYEGKWTLRVSLVVVDRDGDKDPLGLPALLGLENEKRFRKGDPIGRAGSRTHATTGFRFTQYHGSEGDPNEHIAALVARLKESPNREMLLAYKPELAVTLKMHGGTPAMDFSPELMRDIADLGLTVDFDLYNWAEIDVTSS
jgi:hypothetical protein